ncbi:MAG: hypothetical protein IPK73_15805 [Candidatus Obscuribacter sp.]|nr:hypothetical protein [Candidatus Obscuribacter sp.]MBK9278907.1 hypothetical protein [Candidatus Obscuribacter sp.]MBL8083409.1 hypothetical protein [Candidatus Obscuribacter sp.]
MQFFQKGRNKTGSAAEMPLAMFILFVIFAFPLIDLVALTLSYGSVWFISFQASHTASTQTDFGSALSAALKKTVEFNSSGFTAMLKMTPVAGFQNSGTDLYIDSVDFMDDTKCLTIGPNKAVPPPIDLTNRFYQVRACTTYSMDPFIDLKAVPFIGSVPALGRPVALTATVKRCAEFPQGLVRGPGNGPARAANPAQSAQSTSFASPVAAVNQATEPWVRPRIYEEISSAGERVVDHTVVQVDAANPDWTDTGVVVKPGQIVYIDFRADGLWTGQDILGSSKFDADGGYMAFPGLLANGANAPDIFGNYHPRPALSYSLVGKIDPQNPVIMAKDYDFNAGKQLYKYKPTRTGPLSLGFWNPGAVTLDNFFSPSDISAGRGATVTQAMAEQMVRGYYAGHHKGLMTVRIIVTQ